MKYIHIFLASSIVSFKNERIEIGDFIRKLNNQYINKGIYFFLVISEDFSESLAAVRKQDLFNQSICECEYFFMLVGSDVGNATLEEFQVALNHFKQNGLPRIYTYFMQVSPENCSDAVQSLIRVLDKSLGHYYSTYKNMDYLKLKILLEFIRDPNVSGEVTFFDGELMIDKKPSENLINISKIPIYENNSVLKQMREQQYALNARFMELTAAFARDPMNSQTVADLADCANERKKLDEQIHKLENEIFMLCELSVSMPAEHASERELRARSEIENGNYQGALDILRDSMRESELEQAEKVLLLSERLQKKGKAAVSTYLSENQLRIRILETVRSGKKETTEIERLYHESCELVQKYGVELRMLNQYIDFMIAEKHPKKALNFGNHLIDQFEASSVSEEQQVYIAAVEQCGRCCAELEWTEKSEAYYLQAIRLRRDNSRTLNDIIALIRLHGRLGELYIAANRFSSGEEILLNGIRMQQDEQDLPKEIFLPLHQSLGMVYSLSRRFKEAAEHYSIVLEQYREEKADESQADMIICYNNYAVSCIQIRKFRIAHTYLTQASEISRSLKEWDPEQYIPLHSMALSNLALLTAKEGNFPLAMQYGTEAVKALDLISTMEDDFRSLYSNAEHNIGLIAFFSDQTKEAERHYNTALRLCTELEQEMPVYHAYRAMVCLNLGVLFERNAKHKKAEQHYQDAIDAWTYMLEHFSTAYFRNVAAASYNLAMLYSRTQREEESALLKKQVLNLFSSMPKEKCQEVQNGFHGFYKTAKSHTVSDMQYRYYTQAYGLCNETIMRISVLDEMQWNTGNDEN